MDLASVQRRTYAAVHARGLVVSPDMAFMPLAAYTSLRPAVAPTSRTTRTRPRPTSPDEQPDGPPHRHLRTGRQGPLEAVLRGLPHLIIKHRPASHTVWSRSATTAAATVTLGGHPSRGPAPPAPGQRWWPREDW